MDDPFPPDAPLLHHRATPTKERLYGLFKGRIEQRTDPEKLGRLRVRVVGVHSNAISVEHLAWASPRFPVTNGGGDSYIPPVGQMTWIEFEQGFIDYPVWDGGWWATGEAPNGDGAAKNKEFHTSAFGGGPGTGVLKKEQFKGINDADQPNNFVRRSPLGKHHEMDDRTSHQGVKLSDQLDNFVHVNTEDGSLTIRVSKGLTTQEDCDLSITLDATGKVVQVKTQRGWTAIISDKDNVAQVLAPQGTGVRLEDAGFAEIRTHQGTYVTLDNNKINAATPGNRMLAMDDAAGKVSLSGPTGALLIDASGVSIVASTGKVHLQGASGVDVLAQSGNVLIKGVQAWIQSIINVIAPKTFAPPATVSVKTALAPVEKSIKRY